MIHFQLKCCDDHRFDGWFRSGSDFENQLERGLIQCSICGTQKVEKALMRPALGSGASSSKDEEQAEDAAKTRSTPEQSGDMSVVAPSDASAPVTPQEKTVAVMKALWAELQSQARSLREKSDYVGPRFADEARKIHYGEAKKRGVYGEASREEVEALADEGIMALPLPTLPEDRN